MGRADTSPRGWLAARPAPLASRPRIKGWPRLALRAQAAHRRGPSFRAGLEAQIVMAAIERSAATGETVTIETA